MYKAKSVLIVKKLALTLMLCFVPLAFLTVVTFASAQEEAPAATYVEKETCAECHEDVAKALAETAHGQKGFEMRSDKGCQTCHGPGSIHVESNDPKDIRSFKKMTAAESSDACLSCHENAKRTLWKGSVHQQRDLACTTCHSVHNAKSEKWQLKTAKQEDTCSTCHLQVKAQLQRSSHHPIREGLISCADCHNAHGTNTPKLVKANSTNEQCYTCHMEKRGPFLWEHPPVRENCLNCHTPHGSNHPKLMVEKRPYLCQNCHLDTRHPGTLYDKTNVLTSNREFSRSCSNCHLTLHGSNHPSGWSFLR